MCMSMMKNMKNFNSKSLNIVVFVLLCGLIACKNETANKATPSVPSAPQNDKNVTSQNTADSVAIADVVHRFYKWYETYYEKTDIDYLDSKVKVTKLIIAKVNAYHAELLKTGFVNKTYTDNDMAYLKKCEADWQANKENANETPLSGLDFDRVVCGQDADFKAYTTNPVKLEGLGTNQVKASIEASKLTLMKENGKWLISKIICE